MKRHRILLSMVFLLGTLFSFAQTTIKGVVIDQDTKEPLVGVTILHEGSKEGSTTDLDGSFTMKVRETKGQLLISYIGYTTRTMPIKSNLGSVELKSSTIGLTDVVVTSSVAIRRKTPVAISVIEPELLEAKLSTQEFPEILKSTPGVYATKQGGGYGDSRINLRGFESANIAVMINGVPMNDMEWGGVYWSNWAGLSDVTRSLQVQRGLGASKVASPSIGGSINIVTKSTDAKKGGSASYAIGNDGYNKISFNVSTGLTDNGWAMTFLGAKTWGDGYILGTEFEGYSYFLNVSKIINDAHQLSFTAFGAPQWHNQRNRNDLMEVNEWTKVKEGTKFNPTYGFGASGERINPNRNRYHKPQISLNHFWTINEKSSLSTALYLSIGDGGGNMWTGDKYADMYGTDNTTGTLNTEYRSANGYRDFGTLQKENAALINGSRLVLAEQRNNHIWTGLLSTYTTKLSKEIDLYGGIDLRYYEGLHDAKITDLMGGRFFIDPDRKNVKDPNRNTGLGFTNEKLKVGDIVYRDFTGYVVQEGLFGQAEYNKDKLSVFLSGSVSNSTYWKVDRYYYDNAKSETKNFLGYNAKTGANYNLTDKHNVFFNTGYLSRAPFMSGGYFTSMRTSNVTNKNAVNEKSYSAEIGYGFRSPYLTANLNLYHTVWMDKTMTKNYVENDGRYSFLNLQGVDARHQGIELDLVAKPVKNLELTAMVSIGDWRWTSNAVGYIYDADGRPYGGVDDQSPGHRVEVNLKDVKVGNSAQTTFALGGRYKFLRDFNIGLDYTYYTNNYANYKFDSNLEPNRKYDYYTPWKIPAAGVLDFNANYKFKLGGFDATLYGNINNLLDQVYITDAEDRKATTQENNWTDASVMYGFGRTYSVSLKIKF